MNIYNINEYKIEIESASHVPRRRRRTTTERHPHNIPHSIHLQELHNVLRQRELSKKRMKR